MPVYDCSFPGCTFQTKDVAETVAPALLTVHGYVHAREAAPQNNNPTPASVRQRAPKIDRPKISRGSSEETWNSFSTRWTLFKRGTDMSPAEIVQQLFQCCDDDLGNAVLKTSPDAVEGTEDNLLAAIKQLAVVPVAISVRRTDFLSTHQDHGESVRAFLAKLKGKSATCRYSNKCSLATCTQLNDFTDIVVKDVLVAGLVDEDIKKDVLGWSELDSKDVNETVAFIESKEMARDALSHQKPVTAALSQYKKGKTLANTAPASPNSKGLCKTCKVEIDKLVWSKRQKKFVETSLCLPCWQKANPKRVKDPKPAADVKDETAALLVGALSTATVQDDGPSQNCPSVFIGAVSDVPTNEQSKTTPSATGKYNFTLPIRMHVVLTFIVAPLPSC